MLGLASSEEPFDPVLGKIGKYWTTLRRTNFHGICLLNRFGQTALFWQTVFKPKTHNPWTTHLEGYPQRLDEIGCRLE